MEALLVAVLVYYCYQTRMVPGIINKTRAILKSVTVLAVAAVVCYGVTEGAELLPWQQELSVGLAFFVACMFLFYFYFAPTCYYVLMGYDLDKNLQVVKAAAQAAIADVRKVAASNGSERAQVYVTRKGEEDEDDPLLEATEEQRKMVYKYMPNKVRHPSSLHVQGTHIPTHPHTLTPSHPHTLTPSHPHTHTPSHPHTLTPSHPHTLTPSHPHTSPTPGAQDRRRMQHPRRLPAGPYHHASPEGHQVLLGRIARVHRDVGCVWC